jgi:hypothetical protein
MPADLMTLSRAEITSLRYASSIERGHVMIRRPHGSIDRDDALLNMAERSLDEPTRLAAARAEGAAEMRDWVLRLIRGVRDDVQAKAAGEGEEADRARHHMDVILALVIEVASKTSMQVFDVLDRARAEGVREGIEMAARLMEAEGDRCRDYGASLAEDALAQREYAAAATCRMAASKLRALAPAPAWTPTHRHYKGALYRVTKRGKRIWAGNDDRNGALVVEYDNAAGGEFALPDADFDGEVEGGRRRYEPLSPEPAEPEEPPCPVCGNEVRGQGGYLSCECPAPAEPVQTDDGWIEWKGGECPVEARTPVEIRFRSGTGTVLSRAGQYSWEDDGKSFDIVAYRIVKPAEPSAPVAPTRCQAASLRNDGECLHPLCPVPRGITVARLHCALPGAGDDYVDENELPPRASAPVAPEPVIKAIERVLDECSAWIARPSPDVTKRAAIAAGFAWQAAMGHEANRIPDLEERISALEAENAKLRERNAALEDGLRPFAAAAGHALEAFGVGKSVTLAVLDRVAAYFVGWTHYKRARALLQGGPDAG